MTRRGCNYICHSITERWVSGLNQQFAKLSYVNTRTGGSNPPLSAFTIQLHYYNQCHISLQIEIILLGKVNELVCIHLNLIL